MLLEKPLELTQRISARSVQTITFDGEYLIFAVRSGDKTEGGKVAVLDLDENTVEGGVRSTGWLGVAAGALGLGLVVAAAGTLTDGQDDRPWQILRDTGFTLVCLLPGMVGLIVAWKLAVKEGIGLLYAGSNEPMAVIVPDCPSRAEVQPFLDGVLKEARRARKERDERATLTAKQCAVVGEIRNLHDLRTQGRLVQNEYDARKTALLTAFPTDAATCAVNDDLVLGEICQRQGPFRHCALTLYPNRLQVTETTWLNHRRTVLRFDDIQDEPDDHRRIGDGLCYLLLAGALVAVAIGAGSQVSTGHRISIPAVVVCLIFVFSGVVAVMAGFMAMAPIRVFSSTRMATGALKPYVWLRRALPSREVVDEFVNKTRRARVEWLERQKVIRTGEQVVSTTDVLEKVAALRGDGIITEQEFAEAKRRILESGAERGGIGFRPAAPRQ